MGELGGLPDIHTPPHPPNPPRLALPSTVLIQVLEFGFRVREIQKCDLLDSLSFVRCKERSAERLSWREKFRSNRRALEEGFSLLEEPLQEVLPAGALPASCPEGSQRIQAGL